MATPHGGGNKHNHGKRHDRDDDHHNDRHHQKFVDHGTDAFKYLIHDGVLSTVSHGQHQPQTIHQSSTENRDEFWQRVPQIDHDKHRLPSVFDAHEIPRLDEQHDTIKAVSFSPLPHSIPLTVDGSTESNGFKLIHGDHTVLHAASNSNATLSGGGERGEVGFYSIHSHDVAPPITTGSSDSTKSRDQHTIIWGTTMILANDLHIAFTDLSHLTHHDHG